MERKRRPGTLRRVEDSTWALFTYRRAFGHSVNIPINRSIEPRQAPMNLDKTIGNFTGEPKGMKRSLYI
jgi:hypothetical protein